MNKEEYLLVVLAEECSETIKDISKALRFGLKSVAPGESLTNIQKIEKELEDILAVRAMLKGNKIIKPNLDTEHILDKIERVKNYVQEYINNYD